MIALIGCNNRSIVEPGTPAATYALETRRIKTLSSPLERYLATSHLATTCMSLVPCQTLIAPNEIQLQSKCMDGVMRPHLRRSPWSPGYSDCPPMHPLATLDVQVSAVPVVLEEQLQGRWSGNLHSCATALDSETGPVDGYAVLTVEYRDGEMVSADMEPGSHLGLAECMEGRLRRTQGRTLVDGVATVRAESPP
jgi:hypothetical protein